MDMKSGKTTTGKPWTLPTIAISDGFFVYCGKMDRRSFLPIPSAIPWSLEYCLFLDYLKTIQLKPTTPLKENDDDTEAISY